MRDPFSYSARWDSIGLDCAYCRHQTEVDWPNLEKDYACTLHGLNLALLLDTNGHKSGEWFCRFFEQSSGADRTALSEFEEIRNSLDERTLYGGYGVNRELKEVAFIRLVDKSQSDSHDT